MREGYLIAVIAMKKITVKEAAELLGASPQYVRLKCADGTFGEQFGTGKERKSCLISPAKIAAWNGWTPEQFTNELKKLRGEE